MKGYFQMWGLFLSVVYLRWPESFTKNLAWGLFLIALLQLPFVAHEYFVLVPKRFGLGNGIVPVDIVAGTFGAILEAGGANAVLAAYQVIVVACLLALWKNGALSGFKPQVLSLALLSPMAVNQANHGVVRATGLHCGVLSRHCRQAAQIHCRWRQHGRITRHIRWPHYGRQQLHKD